MKLFRTAVLCLARDEDYYVDEWMSYHFKLGFDSVCMIQNKWRYGGQYGTDGRLRLFSEDIHLDADTQTAVYNQYLNAIRQSFDFVAVLDVDEFMFIDGIDLQGFLASHSADPAIFMKWRVFGDNGLTEFDASEASVLKRFTRCAKDLHSNGKSIINTMLDPSLFSYKTPHHVVDARTGTLIRNNDPRAEVYHFRNKTRKERAGRMFGKGNPSLFDEYNKNEVVNIKARRFLYGF